MPTFHNCKGRGHTVASAQVTLCKFFGVPRAIAKKVNVCICAPATARDFGWNLGSCHLTRAVFRVAYSCFAFGWSVREFACACVFDYLARAGSCVLGVFLFWCLCVSVFCSCYVCELLPERFRSVRSSDAAEAVVSFLFYKSVVMRDIDVYSDLFFCWLCFLLLGIRHLFSQCPSVILILLS